MVESTSANNLQSMGSDAPAEHGLGAKGNNKVAFQINKSLDELVNEDNSMMQRGKQRHHGEGRGGFNRRGREAASQGSHDSDRGHHGRGGRGRGGFRGDDRGGRPSFFRGGYSGHHSRGGFQRERERDEREVPANEYFTKLLEGRRLFVSNLSYDTQWKYLKDHMRQAGDVVRADIFEDTRGNSRGIGLVEFRTKEACNNALQKLNKSMLDGRQIYLQEDTKNHVLPPLEAKKPRDMGGHPNRRDDYEPRAGGRRFRSRSRDRSMSGERNGRQTSHSGDRRQNNNPEVLKIQKRGEKEQRFDEKESIPDGFSLHIGNLPYSVDREQLRNAFKEYGPILHSHVNLDEKGNSRGFGLVEFRHREDAMKASEVMDKATFNGREVQVRAHF